MPIEKQIAPTFDAELIRRYDIPGPRYTSYPTAPHFHSDFGETQFREQAAASNASGRDLSLYLHLPYCDSPCFYCGCLRLVTRDRRKIEHYLQYLLREIEMVAPLFERGRRLKQLHLGGGTPNLLDEAQLGRLMATIRANFDIAADADREFGIEVDPRTTSAAAVRSMGALGFNRISLGIQDFDPNVQKAINRIQSVQQTRDVIEAARASGFRSVNVDLIYGLPRQNMDVYTQTLHTVIALAPDRIATYSYAHMPHLFKAQKHIVDAELPSASEKLALLERTVQTLTEGGYRYIGMDHFALATDDLSIAQDNGTLQRNFQGYSTHADCDLIALGLSAIGKVGDSYSQNAKHLVAYTSSIDSGRLPIVRGIRVDADDRIRRALISTLMCNGAIDIRAFERAHDLSFADYFSAELGRLTDLQHDGLVEVDARSIRVTSRGRLLMRVVAMAFDAYLARHTEAPRHSRAI